METQDQRSLEGRANESNRWKRLGKRALNRAKHESKLLPYEAVSAAVGSWGGYEFGKVASTARSYIDGGNWEANNFDQNLQKFRDIITGDFVWMIGGFMQNLNQNLQDLEYGIVGGIAGALLTIYPGRKLGKYINNKLLSRNNKESII